MRVGCFSSWSSFYADCTKMSIIFVQIGEESGAGIGNMIRISRKSFEDWLKAEGLDDETE